MWTHSKMSRNLTHCKAEEMARLRLAVPSVWPPCFSSTFYLQQPENLNCLNDAIQRLKITDRKSWISFHSPQCEELPNRIPGWKLEGPVPIPKASVQLNKLQKVIKDPYINIMIFKIFISVCVPWESRRGWWNLSYGQLWASRYRCWDVSSGPPKNSKCS